METNGKVVEIFHSIQGEGKYVGMPQVFLRLSACNLQCGYCDTDFNKGEKMEVEYVLREVQRLLSEHAGTGDISITGGEPLLQEKFLAGVLPKLKEIPLRVLLETNGTLPAAMQQLRPWVDIVAMDIKLPSVSGTPACWDEHRAFLAACAGKDAYVKIVVSASTDEAEWQKAVELLARATGRLSCVLQPVTALGGAQAPSLRQLRRWTQMAGSRLRDVRVIPQMHKLWGIP